MFLFDYLGLKFNYIEASSILNPSSLKGTARLIQICEHVNADTYINLPGGQKLYSPSDFYPIELKFLQTTAPTPYPSILESILTASTESIKSSLNDFKFA